MVDGSDRFGANDGQRHVCPPPDTANVPCGNLPRWFCIATRPRESFHVEEQLAASVFPVFHPLHEHRVPGHSPRIVPLFPDYLFARFSLGDDWSPILRMRGVSWVLGAAYRPQALPEGFVEDLIARTSPRRVVDDPLLERFRPGDAVTVNGWRGICEQSQGERIRLLMSLFNRELRLVVPTASVTRLLEG